MNGEMVVEVVEAWWKGGEGRGYEMECSRELGLQRGLLVGGYYTTSESHIVIDAV